MVHVVDRPQAAQGHLGQDDGAVRRDIRLLEKLRPAPLEHVEGELRGRPEAAPLDQDRLLVEHLRGLHDLAALGEHGGRGQALLDELQRHEPVVDVTKRRARELDHVDLDPRARQVVQQRTDQRRRISPAEEGSVEEVDSEHAQRLPLVGRGGVEQMDVQDDLGRLIVRLGLEPDADPATSVFRASIAPGRHGVCEGKEGRRVAAARTELGRQLGELVGEHGLESLPAHVALGRAIERVAHRHVVRRDRLRDRARGAADLKEPARHFLAAAGFGKHAVRHGIEIDGQGLASGTRRCVVHH